MARITRAATRHLTGLTAYEGKYGCIDFLLLNTERSL